MKNKLYNFILALCLVITSTAIAQDLAKDSIKVQKILKETAKGKKAPAMYAITDKEKVDFISKYIDAKKAEELKRVAGYTEKQEATLGGRYRKGDKGTVPQIVSMLKSNNEDKIFGVINELDKEDYVSEAGPLFLDTEIKSELFKLITQDEFEPRIIQFLGINKVAGYVPLFEERLLSGKSQHNDRMFFWLGRDGKSEKAVDYFIAQFDNAIKDTENGPWFMEGLPYYLEDGTEANKKKIMDFLFDYMEKHPITLADMMKEDEESTFDPKIYILQTILTSEDKRVPAFSEKTEKKFGAFMPAKEKAEFHETMQLNLLKFYDLPKKKEIVLAARSSKDDFFDLLTRINQDEALLQDKDVVRYLFSKYDAFEINEEYLAEEFIRHFIFLDAEGFKAAVAEVKSAERRKVLTMYYNIAKQTITETNDYLFKKGLIAAPITQEQVNSLQKDDMYPEGSAIYNSLQLSGIKFDFDTEPNIYPADHDVLIEEFAKHSQGKLQGVTAYQQSRYNEKDETSDITLFVVYKDKCFVMLAEDFEDWYDMETFDQLQNAIVAEAKIKERFVAVNTDDQTASYIFGEPQKVQQLVKDYKLEYEEAEEEE